MHPGGYAIYLTPTRVRYQPKGVSTVVITTLHGWYKWQFNSAKGHSREGNKEIKIGREGEKERRREGEKE